MKEETINITHRNEIGIIGLVIPDHLKDAGITDIHSDKDNDTLVIRYKNKRFLCTLNDKYSTAGEIYSLPERLYYATNEILDESLVYALSRYVKENWSILTGHSRGASK